MDEDGFDLSLEGSQLDVSSSERSQNFPSLPDIANVTGLDDKSFSNVAEIGVSSLTNLRNMDDKHVIKEFEAEEIDSCIGALNNDAWGASLNKVVKTDVSATYLPTTASQEVRKSVTNKLFKNSSFSVRNPRKSLSRNNSAVATSISQQLAAREVLPDLESILVEKAKKQMDLDNHEVIVKSDQLVGQTTSSLHAVDTKWLNRCSLVNSLGNPDEGRTETFPSQPVKYGLSNLNVNLKVAAQVQITPSLAMSSLAIGERDPQIGQVETYAQPTTYDHTRNCDDDDDDEVIENSEDEAKAADISIMRHVVKKRKIEDVKPKVTSPKINVSLPEIVLNKKCDTTTQPSKLPMKPKRSKRSADAPSSKSISAATRRSTRNATRIITKDSSSSEWDAVDSDNDPEYKLSKEELLKEMHDGRDDEIEEPNKLIISNDKPIKQKSKKKEAATDGKKPKRTVCKSSSKQPIGTRNSKPIDQPPDLDEDEEDEPQGDYQPEFGGGNIQSVPRININELHATSQAFEQYVHTTQTHPAAIHARRLPSKSTDLDSTTAASYDSLEKRAKDRAKIEKKISAGTLNENFVRINIQKKVFSRGHKTVNFSRYKKNQWKKTKAAAALAGPEMDMRGCDGGFLVCFQCGQQGHFAQDCKVQSEYLIAC